jgi:hypothetical protein
MCARSVLPTTSSELQRRFGFVTGACAAAWCRAEPRPQDRRADGHAAGRDCAGRESARPCASAAAWSRSTAFSSGAGEKQDKWPLPIGRRAFRRCGPGEHWTPKAPARGASAPGDSLAILTTPPTTSCDRALTGAGDLAPGSLCALARSIVETQAPRPTSSCAICRSASGQQPSRGRCRPDRPDRRADTGLGR